MPAPSLPPEAVQSRLVFALLAANFFFPALAYAAAPAYALGQLERVAAALGSGPYPFPGDLGSVTWRILAFGNVMTLALMCALLSWDVRRWLAVLPPLVFMKSAAALGFLLAYATTGWRGFAAVFVLDAVSASAMAYFAPRAARSLEARAC